MDSLQVRAHTADMAALRVSCERCGDVQVSIRVVVAYPEAGEIRVDCPVCRQLIVREVDPEIMETILEHGPKIRRVRAPITYDDILEFHDRFDDEMRELLR